MANEVKLYPFGFAFSDSILNKIPNHYGKKLIVEKYHYYYDYSSVKRILENRDKFIIIHGDFVHVGINQQMSHDELMKNLLKWYYDCYERFLDTLDFIAGRYVIIIGNKDEVKVFPDAANTRSTYYASNKNIVASHVHLINDQYQFNKVDFKNKLPLLINTLTHTPFENIESLIPNYYFDFYSKKQKRFFPRKDNQYTSLSEDEKFELFEHFWKKQLEYYFSQYDNFVFSLSGGGDSRFSLALLKEYINRVQFFTYTTIEGEDNSSSAAKGLTVDYKIVKQMLEDISLNHNFFYYVENRKELTEEEKSILNKNTIGKHSSFLIPYVRHYYPGENLKHIRGNLLEIGQTRYYRSEYKDSNINEAKKVFDNRHKRKNVEEDYQILHDKLFYEFVEDMDFGKGIYDYHLLDTYHWEIRMGRWHPEILNTHDIVFDTISPFNHRASIDITLAFPYEQRRSEYMFKEIINRNYPILNFYGDNDVLNLYEQSKK